MKAAMSGATQQYKQQMRLSVDAATFADIQAAATQILKQLPKYPLGTTTAALMLAATAFAEGSTHAEQLIAGEPIPPKGRSSK
jgi:hypothetical protein